MKSSQALERVLIVWAFVPVLLCLSLCEEVLARGSRESASQARQPGVKARALNKATGKGDAAREKAGESEKSLGEPGVVVTGNLGVVRYSPLFFDNLPLIAKGYKNIICFSVRSLEGPVSNAKVTATGLGDVEFGLLDGGAKTCPEEPPQGATTLSLPELKPDVDTRVWMRFPSDLISNTGDVVEGKILVLAPQKKSLELPLKVQAPSWSSFFTALLWSIGVIIPGIIALYFGYWGNVRFGKWEAQQVEKGKLIEFIDENYEVLGKLFKVHLATVMENADNDFPTNMKNALDTRGIIGAIPKSERQKLKAAIARCQRDQIRKALARLFPDWGDHIDPQPTVAQQARAYVGGQDKPEEAAKPPQNLRNEGVHHE